MDSRFSIALCLVVVLGCGAEPWETEVKLGIERQKAKDISGAIKHFEDALSLNSNLVELHFELAKLYFDSGDVEEAKKYILKTIKVAPATGEAHLMLALIHQKNGDLAAAEEVHNQALKYLKGAESAIGYAIIGYLRYVEAVEEKERAQELTESGDITEADRARNTSQQKLKEAEQNLLTATQKDPDLYMAQYNLGNVYLDQYFAKRKEKFRGADAERRKEMEIAFIEQKKAAVKEKLDLAILAYERAVAAHPTLSDAHKKLGIIFDGYMLENSGADREKAASHFEKYLELVRDDEEISERLKLIRER